MEESQTINYSYEAVPASSAGTEAAAGAAIAIVLFFIIVVVGTYVLNAIFLSKIFKKAGVSGWKAWVPFLNMWKILELGGQQGFWLLVNFVPFVGSIIFYVMQIIAIHNINKKMGYEIGMTVLYALFPIIWVIIAGLNKLPWNDSLGAPRVDRPEFVVADAAQQSAAQPGQPIAPTMAPPQPQTPQSFAPVTPEPTPPTTGPSVDTVTSQPAGSANDTDNK